MELCLGTVQFGMQYGIVGHKQPSFDESIKMLDYATQNGIVTLDTANAYGNAENIVGEFLNKRTIERERIRIISKLQPNILDFCESADYYKIIKKYLESTLCRLHSDYLDGFLLHSARYVFNKEILESLTKLKAEGYVKIIGVSVYESSEAIKGIENPEVDLIQLPYSIFDQRMNAEGVFDLARQGLEIHSRSAFLQGLLTMKERDIPKHLARAVPIVSKINEICEKYGLSKIALALNYVKKQKNIDCLVFGVHNMEQLKEDMVLFHQTIDCDIVEKIADCFKDIETDIIMPSLWHK